MISKAALKRYIDSRIRQYFIDNDDDEAESIATFQDLRELFERNGRVTGLAMLSLLSDKIGNAKMSPIQTKRNVLGYVISKLKEAHSKMTPGRDRSVVYDLLKETSSALRTL